MFTTSKIPYLQSTFKFSTLKQRSIILQIILFFASLHCFGQASKTDSLNTETGKWINFAGGVILQRQLMGEIGINYVMFASESSCGPDGFAVLKLTSEFSSYHGNLLLGPKIGFEINATVIALKLSVVNYTDFKTNDTRLVPEIGFGTGFIDFFYGRNISLSKSKYDVISKNRFSITVNLGKQQ